MKSGTANPALILTVGHSTRPIEEFLDLVGSHEVERVVDVRTIPRSRHNPQFNGDTLGKVLARRKIGYTQLKALGGLRHPRPDSPNMAWRNRSFRGFADYMQTPDFARGLERLLGLASRKRCAIMCAEAVPWRCHRSLIADALTARGIPVEHILGPGRREIHRLTPFARVHAGSVTYPAESGLDPRSVRKAARATQPAGQLALQYAAEMPRRKRPAKFSLAKEAKRQARESAGLPPAERVIPDKRRRPPKHKKSPLEENSA